MSLFSKVAKFASSPQGKAAIAKAKDAANDPKNRAKIDELVGKVKSKGGRPATPPSTSPVTDVRAEQLSPPAPVTPPRTTPPRTTPPQP